MTSFRWTVCALIFFATTVNYFDRQLFSVLVPFIEKDFKLTPLNLAFINSSFVLPYGLSMLFVGRQIDKVGVKKGLSVGYLIWSAASFLHAFVPGMQALAAARMLLGVGESALYPTGVKTMSEWFPTKERALATGIFNAGANGGAMLAPILGVWLEAKYGWRSCFMVTAAAGLVWLFFWRRLYQPPDESSRVSKEELDYIRSDRPANQPSLTVRQVLSIPSVYGLIIAKALTDGPFWFYLFWMPKFLVDQCHMKPSFMQWSLPVIYVVADIGSIAGGWASSRLVRRGVPVRRSRQTVMLVCAVLVLPVIPIGWVDPTFQGAYFAVAGGRPRFGRPPRMELQPVHPNLRYRAVWLNRIDGRDHQRSRHGGRHGDAVLCRLVGPGDQILHAAVLGRGKPLSGGPRYPPALHAKESSGCGSLDLTY